MPHTLPLSKRVIFSALVLVAALALAEGALALVPVLYQASRDAGPVSADGAGRMVICVGDSVTSGQGLDASLSYPRQLSTRVAGRAGKIPVTQMARPGADSGALKQDVAPNLMRVADGARPVAVVMLGHNDFLDWSGGSARRAFVGSAAGSSASEHGDPRDAHRPRLLRLWRWFTTAWMGEVPAFKVDASRVERLRANFARLHQAVRNQQGELFVLTYVVPGPPPEGMPAQAAEILRQTIDGQRAVNRVLRAVAAGLHAPLIDAEMMLSPDQPWDPQYFQDNIHLSAEGYALLAELVDKNLQLTGWL